LFPPLEQAPDQIALRPFETVRVIADPLVNDADPVLPTDTLMPAGVDVIRSPLRPVAMTVTASVWPGAVTASAVVRVAPPYTPVIVAEADVVTALVVIENVALVAPAATVTLAGTPASAALLLVSVTTAPPDGAVALRVAVPCDPAPPTTEDGLSVITESAGVTGVTGGVKLRTLDHAPAVPAEFTPRTRHQCCRSASDVTVNCDAATVCSTTRGAEKSLESST
jgi:hypothetical protein